MDTRTIFELAAAAILLGLAIRQTVSTVKTWQREDDQTCIDCTDIQLVTEKWDTKPLTEEEAAEMAVSRWDLN